jgi:hypothetical protein
MGANATTFVPAYVSGEVLTAADLTVTNSGIPVFADSTARTAAFGGTGEKVLAEGQYAYLESDNSTSVYDGAAWQPVGASGLVRVGGGALSGSSTAFTNIFSSTYDSYTLVFSNIVTAGAAEIRLQLGATTTGYYWAAPAASYSGNAYNSGFGGGSNVASFVLAFLNTTSGGFSTFLSNPNLAVRTEYSSSPIRASDRAGIAAGFLDNATQYTGFTISPSTSTMTGTLNIYGYTLS